jgi:RHS repeat-associated protein
VSFGKRVGGTVSGRDDEYIYDNDGHLNSVLGNGLLERMYIYMSGQLLAEYFESTTYFVHSDHLGSIRLLTRLDQTARESDDYYPFGEQIPPTGGTAGTLKFTGKERDGESGLDNFGARYDASSLGRFMTPDWAAKPTTVPYVSFSDPQTLNLYAYVREALKKLVANHLTIAAVATKIGSNSTLFISAESIRGFTGRLSKCDRHIGRCGVYYGRDATAVIADPVSEPLVHILYVGPLMPTDYFVWYVDAGEELRLHGLSERYPESVDVTNDELTCAVEGIIKVFDDLNPILKASMQVIDVIGSYVQVDLATVVRARSPGFRTTTSPS